jgi:tetratricopeptide (TPR) repeat protein
MDVSFTRAQMTNTTTTTNNILMNTQEQASSGIDKLPILTNKQRQKAAREAYSHIVKIVGDYTSKQSSFTGTNRRKLMKLLEQDDLLGRSRDDIKNKNKQNKVNGSRSKSETTFYHKNFIEDVPSEENGLPAIHRKKFNHSQLSYEWNSQQQHQQQQQALPKEEYITDVIRTYSTPILDRARFDIMMGNYSRALIECVQSIVSNPTNAEGYYEKGRALQGMNRTEEAVLSYEYCYLLSPSYELQQKVASQIQKCKRILGR